MVLQSSGAISLNDIQTEFGGTNPISISEYYGKDGGIPASGEISFDDFYGASNYILSSSYQSQLSTWGYTPYSLVYKAATHGLSNSTFHSYCDSFFETIVVIKTVNGYIFGGIAVNSWSGSGYKSSPNTNPFVFNLSGNSSAPIKWNITNTAYNIYAGDGPTFGGGHDIYTSLNTNSMYENDHSYGNGGGYTGRVTGYTNSGTNRIVDIEVWSILILTSSYQSQLSTWGYTPDSLVYKARIHGFTNAAFHSYCDTLSQSIVVIKTINGYIFGGIAVNSWSGSGYKSSTDLSPFVFNLAGNPSAPIKWNTNYTNFNIYASSGNGPIFGGGHDIYINLNNNKMYTYMFSYGSGGYNGLVSGYTNQGYGRIVDVEVWSIA